MPYLNKNGQWANGKGGTSACFMGQVLAAPAGGTSFLDDEYHVVYSKCVDTINDVWRLWLHNVQTNASVQIADHGANALYAGGGHWAAWLNGTGIIASTGFRHNAAGLLGMGPDGSIAYKPDYHGSGPTIVREPDGQEYILTHGHAAGLQLLGSRRAVWEENHQIRTYNIPAPQAVGSVYNPQAVEVNGQWWFSYWSEGNGIVLHPSDSQVGYRVLPMGQDGWATMRAFGNSIHFAISRTEGEGPNDVYPVNIDLSQPRLNLGVTLPPVSVNPLPRKVWITPFFSHSERYGDTPMADHVGNAITVVSGGGPDPTGSLRSELNRIRGYAQPMFVQGDMSVEPINVNQTIAWWVSGANITELAEKVAIALRQPEKPVIAYLDNRDWPAERPSWLSPRVWPSLMCYRMPGEPLDEFNRVTTAMISRVQAYGQPMVLTARFDDFNGRATVESTLQCMPLYDHWLRTGYFVGLMPFSDRRGNGIAKVPALQAWAKAFLAANAARPNRFDYWVPSGDIAGAIKNKLLQTTETIVLLPAEKTYLLGLLPKS